MNYSKPNAYAVYSKNEDIVKNSSSGGVFTELANNILSQNGYVFGVSFDAKFHAQHICIDNKDDLYKIRGSKYLQSNVGDCYNKAMELAKNNKVLFSGTPCQIAALNRLINDEIKNNIYTCEVICHGVPSQKVFDAYLKYISKNKKIVSYNFRDKTQGWDDFGVKVTFDDNTEYFRDHRKDWFMYGFLEDIYLRSSCYNCKFATTPRQADITIGDYWGVPKDLKNINGTSVVFTNNEKASEFLLSNEELNIKETTYEDAIKYNQRMVSGIIKKNKKYDNFYDEFNTKDFSYIIKKYLTPKNTVFNYTLRMVFRIINKLKSLFNH